MAFDFDRITDRRNTDSLKYDFAAARGKPEDILPLWVADMDFPTPDCVRDALLDRVNHGIFGYSDSDDGYIEALRNWFTGRFGYTFEDSWVVKTPGVVYAICTAIRAFTDPGDAVLIQEPVYYPFRGSILANERRLVVNALVERGGEYTIDFADFEERIKTQNVRLFVLCSPHNPVGRVWREDELRELVRICQKYDVLIVSDEIHCDFVYPGSRHQVLPALVPEERNRIILCTAPSKTFNLAGLQISNIFIADRGLRRKFQREMDRSGYSQVGQLGIVACRAAYRDGGPWLDALLAYLGDNMAFTGRFLEDHLPNVKLIKPQGTYLAWLDCRGLKLPDDELDRRIVHEAGLWLDRGDMFGPSGAGFQRINVACPHGVLEGALKRLAGAFS